MSINETTELQAETEDQESQKEETSSEFFKFSKEKPVLSNLSPLGPAAHKAMPTEHTGSYFSSVYGSVASPPPEQVLAV